MKSFLYSLLLIFSVNFMRSQDISFEPISTHFYEPYTVTVSGNGILYYTTDGTEPTLSSNSAQHNFSIEINTNKTIKAFLIDNQ